MAIELGVGPIWVNPWRVLVRFSFNSNLPENHTFTGLETKLKSTID